MRSRSLILATIVATGCAAPGGQSGHTFELIDEGGVAVAVNSATPRFGGELFRYEKVVEIVPDPAVEDSYLYDPYGLAVDDDGRIYVGEQGNYRVSVWNLDGNYLHSIGKRGEGPGEFPFGPVFNIYVRDNVLSVPMLQNGRTIRFRTDGTYLDTLWHTSVPRPMSIHEGPDGQLVIIDQPGDREFSARVTVTGADDEVVATMETDPVRIMNYSGAAQAVFVPPDEVMLTTGVEPVVRWHGLDGELRRELRIALPVEPVTAADREALISYIDDRIARAPETRDEPGGEGGTKDLWRRRRERVEFPVTKGFWAGVLVSNSGWLWLIKARPEMLDYSMNHVLEAHVVSPEGRYVGTTRLPPMFAPSGLQGDLLLAEVNDVDTGERVPTVFRVRTAVGGLDYPDR